MKLDEDMQKRKHVIKKSMDLYLELKKYHFSDLEINKVARILQALSS